MRLGLDKLRGVLPSFFSYVRVSFAEYAEDLILSCLGSQRRGFYVDVGAHHPRAASNTYKLYLRGWSGITIEPNPESAPLFKRVRPRDTHLTVGISTESAELTYYKFADPLKNSFHPDWPRWQKEKGSGVVEQVPVRCLTLTEVLDRYRPQGSLDLLSIDCEGYDLEVIKSLDWKRYRPTLVIVEDFEHHLSGVRGAGSSTIRTFLTDRQYGLVSQAVFSFFYVDRRAISQSEPNGGFRLNQPPFHQFAVSKG